MLEEQSRERSISITTVLLSFIVNKGESPRKREVKNCLDHIGLWTSLL